MMEIIIGKNAGFCYGVKNAVDGAKNELLNNGAKHCLGEIVHNKQVVEELEEMGIEFVEKLDDVAKQVIVRAHGIPTNIYEEARGKGIKLIDYTCPNVHKIHKIAIKYKEAGYIAILVGAKNHPENLGTISYCSEGSKIIESKEEIEETVEYISKNKYCKILLIAQTTYSMKKFKEIETECRKQFNDKMGNNLELVVNNTICFATEVRQKETSEISKLVEFMIIIGGKKSSNTKKLYEISKVNCKNTICIETVEELKCDQQMIKTIKNIHKIGIMAGASTPKKSIYDTEEFLKTI